MADATVVATFARPAASLRDLAEVRRVVGDACAAAGADGPTTDALVLAVDEVCANVLQHGYGARAGEGGGPLDVAVARAPDALVVRVTDAAPHFDPAVAAPEPAHLDAPADDRPIGGLGWHLVRRSVDEVAWTPLPGRGNRVTLRTRLARPRAGA